MTNNTIKKLWEHIKLASKAPKIAEGRLSMANEFNALYNPSDYAYVAIYELANGTRSVVIAFKGTNATAKAWAMDFDAYPLKNDEQWLKGGTIHDGFYTAWSYFKQPIKDILDGSVITNEDKIYVCGHSRGGALSELCARHLKKNLKLDCQVLSTGSPAVGNIKYLDEFKSLKIDGVRIVNGYDIVTALPPEKLGFYHGITKKIMFKAPWYERFMLSKRIKSHYYEEYEKGIVKLI